MEPSGTRNCTKDNPTLLRSQTTLAQRGQYSFSGILPPAGLALSFRIEFANPRASWSSMVGATGLNATIHFAIYLGLTLLYLLILHLLFPSREENTAPPQLQLSLFYSSGWPVLWY